LRDFEPRRRGKRRFDDDDSHNFDKRRPGGPALPSEDALDAVDGLPEGDRWSTWDQSTAGQRGPRPHPDWLVTALAAVDTELGVLKTGKEADVFLLRRGIPQTDESCLLAAKRYRSAEHRLFHRDAGYLEGRRVKESRTNRAMANRTAFGRQVVAAQWADAEFGTLCRLYEAGVPVPYPVQILGTEILLEFIGDADGAAAPRLAEIRARGTDLAPLWDQVVEMLVTLARLGLAHGDLSAYNLLVHRGRVVMIDLPQVVDVVVNPRGAYFLERDALNVGKWFTGHDLTGGTVAPHELPALLQKEAGLT
jgi:RIO kinase 1